MIYFFHHYELPVIIQQAQVQHILRLRTRQRHHQQQQAGNASGVANANGTNQQQATNDNANMPNGNNGQPNEAATAPPNNHININNNNNINNNDNNNNFNANRNVVIHIGNFFNQHMAATLIISRALNIVGAVRNVIANDIFGVAAIFNNNNDNNLNNNNATGAATSHIRINLANLRRINLSGIQINPIERNDDRLVGNVGSVGGGGGGENNTTANNENRTSDNLDGNESDADVESTDECDNLLKKHVRSEEEQHQQQHHHQPDQFKILNLDDVKGKDDDITFASVGDGLPMAPTDMLIDNEIQAPNCHGDPDSIDDAVDDVSLAHFNELLNTDNDDDVDDDDNVTPLPYKIDQNQDKSVDSVAGNHDYTVSIVSSSHKNEMDGVKNSDDCPCIGATTIASIEKFYSIAEECNLNRTGTGDMVNVSGGSRSLANNGNECSNCATGTDSRRTTCSSSSSSNNSSGNGSSSNSANTNSNISDSCKDSKGNRLPIVGPFQ